jgi:hypothetical protein
MPTGVFKEPGKRQDCRHGTHRYFGSDGLHTLRARRCVNHMLLYYRSQPAYIYRLFRIRRIRLGIHAQGT